MLRKSVVFDIDGVLLRGGSLINGAKQAVAKLAHSKIPFIFVTNGGGMLESQKAADLSKKLDFPVLESQVILSHTPLKRLVSQYTGRVLILGKKECVDVAKSYGFTGAVDVDKIASENPFISHMVAPQPSSSKTPTDNTLESVEAAMIFHDPVNWGLEMQILSDVLVDEKGKQRIPFFSTNNDLVYNTEWPHPRFTQGSFVEAFKHLYAIAHGEKKEYNGLNIIHYGKPFPEQYKFAEESLLRESERLAVSAPNLYFGIGDNPKSDVRGANAAGAAWKSVLVRTGIFQSPLANDPIDPADHVCNNVEEAVDLILRVE